MTMPSKYIDALMDFENFLVAALDTSGLSTRNQAYTMTQGVFQTFRRRLNFESAIRFANVLPPILTAIFVADWDTNEPIVPFCERTAMTREAQALRADHNFSPDTCIRDVALALRKGIDEDALNHILSSLPEGAAEFWSI
jgi:uncharacterized protein (DUF2267 family)